MSIAQIHALWNYYEKAMKQAQSGGEAPRKAASMQDISSWLGVPVERGA